MNYYENAVVFLDNIKINVLKTVKDKDKLKDYRINNELKKIILYNFFEIVKLSEKYNNCEEEIYKIYKHKYIKKDKYITFSEIIELAKEDLKVLFDKKYREKNVSFQKINNVNITNYLSDSYLIFLLKYLNIKRIDLID